MAAPTREQFIAYLAAQAANETAQAALTSAAEDAATALSTLETNVRSQADPRFVILADSDEGVDDGYYAAEVVSGTFQVHELELLEAEE